MIYEVEGDILLTKATATAHGVGPDDDFQNGLAFALRQRWPAMYKEFRHFCHTRHPRSGDAWLWSGEDGERLVALFTQEPPKKKGAHPEKATLPHVNHSLRALRNIVESEGFESLALPRLATGVGGLTWEEVRPLLDNHLGDLPIPVYVYTTYIPGHAASEPEA
ncbi:MAG: macro domain-containing protein [bacterium]